MSGREIIWAVVNTNSIKEADKIGRAVLKKRLCACYSIIPRVKSVYYWPPASPKTRFALAKAMRAAASRGGPKSSSLETSKGPLLILETLPKHYRALVKLVKKLHSDKVPFIGQCEMENVDKTFYEWLVGEIYN